MLHGMPRYIDLGCNNVEHQGQIHVKSCNSDPSSETSLDVSYSWIHITPYQAFRHLFLQPH